MLPDSKVCLGHRQKLCFLGRNILALRADATEILGSSLFPKVTLFPVGPTLSDFAGVSWGAHWGSRVGS